MSEKANPFAGDKWQCPECKQVLQSMGRHDYVVCRCSNQASIDGGRDYSRFGCVRSPPILYKEPKA